MRSNDSSIFLDNRSCGRLGKVQLQGPIILDCDIKVHPVPVSERTRSNIFTNSFAVLYYSGLCPNWENFGSRKAVSTLSMKLAI
jgi:hypothetical protein